MPLNVFEAALAMDDECVSIGGGEPTIHPEFWHFIGLAIANVEYVWMATNGKETKTALALARLAKRGVLAVELSLDKWHEKIDPKVVKAFMKEYVHRPFGSEGDQDLRGFRTVTSISNSGRAKKNHLGSDPYSCPCEELVVKPDGSIHQCGCTDAPRLGHVLEEFDRNEFVNDDGEIPCCRKGKLRVGMKMQKRAERKTG
jgi:MoaA/NifB/PqqE/SkfB family radical SAM enzyme